MYPEIGWKGWTPWDLALFMGFQSASHGQIILIQSGIILLFWARLYNPLLITLPHKKGHAYWVSLFPHHVTFAETNKLRQATRETRGLVSDETMERLSNTCETACDFTQPVPYESLCHIMQDEKSNRSAIPPVFTHTQRYSRKGAHYHSLGCFLWIFNWVSVNVHIPRYMVMVVAHLLFSLQTLAAPYRVRVSIRIRLERFKWGHQLCWKSTFQNSKRSVSS